MAGKMSITHKATIPLKLDTSAADIAEMLEWMPETATVSVDKYVGQGQFDSSYTNLVFTWTT